MDQDRLGQTEEGHMTSFPVETAEPELCFILNTINICRVYSTVSTIADYERTLF